MSSKEIPRTWRSKHGIAEAFVAKNSTYLKRWQGQSFLLQSQVQNQKKSRVIIVKIMVGQAITCNFKKIIHQSSFYFAMLKAELCGVKVRSVSK